MLRITVTKKSGDGSAGLLLEGRLEGPWVSELFQVWQLVLADARAPVRVELNGVTYASDSGAELLRAMRLQGAEFAANSQLTSSWLEDQIADGTKRITP